MSAAFIGECQQIPNTPVKNGIFHYIIVRPDPLRCVSTHTQICSDGGPEQRSQKTSDDWLSPAKSFVLLGVGRSYTLIKRATFS